MRTRTRMLGFMLLLALLTAAAAPAAQVESTTTRGVSAVMQANGFYLQPAGIGQMSHGDLAPPQMFEIVRPGNQSVTLGRLFTSCICVTLEADQRSYAPGQPAILCLRNLRATPPSGQNYAIYVQITSPIRTTLRFDTFVQSSQFVPAAAGMPPTRGNIISHGEYTGQNIGYGGTIEVIVPKTDNYISDATNKDAAESGVLAGDDTVAKAEAALAKAKAKADEEAKAASVAQADKAAPSPDAELSAAIEAAVAKAEQNVDKSRSQLAAEGRGEVPQAGVGQVADKARDEAEAAARLLSSGNAPATPAAADAVQDEMKKLGKEMLESGDAPAAAAVAEAVVAAEADGEAFEEVKPASWRDQAAKLGRNLKDKTVSAGKSVARATGNAADVVAEKSHVAAEGASDTWQELKVKSRSLASEIGEGARTAGRYVDDKTQPARDVVSDKFHDAVDAVKDAID